MHVLRPRTPASATIVSQSQTRAHSRRLGAAGSRAPFSDAMLSASFNGLDALRIVRRPRFGDAALAAAATASPQLRELTLAACGEVTDGGLQQLAAACPRLRSLSLAVLDHPELTGWPLHSLAGLQMLTIVSCPRVTRVRPLWRLRTRKHNQYAVRVHRRARSRACWRRPRRWLHSTSRPLWSWRQRMVRRACAPACGAAR